MIVSVIKFHPLLEDQSSLASVFFSLDSEKNNNMKEWWREVQSEIKKYCN